MLLDFRRWERNWRPEIPHSMRSGLSGSVLETQAGTGDGDAPTEGLGPEQHQGLFPKEDLQ